MSTEPFGQTSAPPSGVPRRQATIEDAEQRHQRETEEGIAVPIYKGDENEENFLGYVRCYLDQDGYEKKLARLKAKKGKSHQWSEKELLPLQKEAQIGTFFRGINDPDQPDKDWRTANGEKLADNETNLRRVLGNTFVRRACWLRIGEEESWAADAKEDLQGN